MTESVGSDPERSLSVSQRALLGGLGGMLLAFVAVVAVVLLRPSVVGKTYTYVIPEGASVALADEQEIPGGPPRELSLRLGDTLVVENRDSVGHTYGFLVLAPGETGRYTFKTKGTFKGACTFGAHKDVVITVT